jgi:hypothetical protein
MAFAVRFDEALDYAQAGAFGVFVFAIASARTVRDNPFDVPFVRVEKKADERLFVIGIAARIRFDHDAEAIGGERLANDQNQEEEPG